MTPSATPPRLNIRVFIPAICAAILLAGLGYLAVRSLRQPTQETAALGRGGLSPRIEAPFAPTALLPLSRAEAAAKNAAIPVVTGPVQPATLFQLRASAPTDVQRSLECLTSALYYEAGSESDDGERAVAQVILNRVRHPAFPNTVCGVVLDGAQRRNACQFTFACDGSLARVPSPSGWQRASRIAAAALAGAVYAPVGWATHYHANYVLPYWASSLEKVTTVGAHIFYRWPGAGGRGSAFRAPYTGREPAWNASVLPAPGTPVGPPAAAAAKAGGSNVVPQADRPILGISSGSAAPEDRPGTLVRLDDRQVLTRAGDDAAKPATAPIPGEQGPAKTGPSE